MCAQRYRRTYTASHCQAWVRELEKKKQLILAKQEAYWNARISANTGRPQKLWHCLDSLLLRDGEKSASSQSTVTADKLSTSFDEKGQSVRKSTANAAEPDVRVLTDKTLTAFSECEDRCLDRSMADVRKTLLESPVKSAANFSTA